MKNLDILILAGGLGTRLKPIMQNTPKALAPVNGKVFIDFLVDDIVNQGFKRIILCVGHLKDRIIDYFDVRNDCDIVFSCENDLLGTAGAIKNAIKNIKSEKFIVMNGDSYCKIPLTEFCNFHEKNNSQASIVVCEKKNNSQYGSVILDKKNNKVIKFKEKDESPNGYVNSGIYLFNKSILNIIPDNRFVSLEYEIFPKLVNKNFFGFITTKTMVDIGNPERYKTFIEANL